MFINRGLLISPLCYANGDDLSPRYCGGINQPAVGTVRNITGINFGPPSAKRVAHVIMSGYEGSDNGLVNSCSIAGVTATLAVRASISSNVQNLEIWYALIGFSALDTLAATYSLSQTDFDASVYVSHPNSATPVDAVAATSAAATSLTLTDLAKTAGGLAIFGIKHRDGETIDSMTQTGVESFIARPDLSIGGGPTARLATRDFQVTATTTLNDFTVNFSGGGDPCSFVGATWV